MTDQEKLLWGITNNPKDDLVRLAYADWLEEHGDPYNYAKFIRSQIKSYAGPGCDRFMYSCGELLCKMTDLFQQGCDRCKEWAGQKLNEQSLFESHYHDWIEGPLSWCFSNFDSWERGFPWKIETLSILWENYGKEMIKRFPLTYVTLSDKDYEPCTLHRNNDSIIISGSLPVQDSPPIMWKIYFSSIETTFAEIEKRSKCIGSILPKYIISDEVFHIAYPKEGDSPNWPEKTRKDGLDTLSNALLIWARKQ